MKMNTLIDELLSYLAVCNFYSTSLVISTACSVIESSIINVWENYHFTDRKSTAQPSPSSSRYMVCLNVEHVLKSVVELNC